MTRSVLVVALVTMLAGSVAIARSSLKVGSMSVNDLTVLDLACELDNGGMFAVMGVVGALAKQKKALDACVPAGAAFRVSWTWAGGKATRVEVLAASEPAKSACVQKAVQLTTTDTVGDCRAVVLVGASAAAKSAASKLPAAK